MMLLLVGNMQVTPDLKLGDKGALLHVDLAAGGGRRRLGGSALAQAFAQSGHESPDVDMATLKVRCP